MAIAIVRGNVNHKLGRLHYVRGTAEEAAHTCKTNHSNYRYRPSQRGDLAGTLRMPQRDMSHFNSSRMDAISACLRKTITQQIDQTQQKLDQENNKQRDPNIDIRI